MLFIALAILAAGIASLQTNREVLIETDAGPLVAPIMYALAAVVLCLLLATCTLRARLSRVILDSILFALATYLVFVLSGAVIYLFSTGSAVQAFLFISGNALTPFAIPLPVIAFVVSLGHFVVLSRRAVI